MTTKNTKKSVTKAPATKKSATVTAAPVEQQTPEPQKATLAEVLAAYANIAELARQQGGKVSNDIIREAMAKALELSIEERAQLDPLASPASKRDGRPLVLDPSTPANVKPNSVGDFIIRAYSEPTTVEDGIDLVLAAYASGAAPLPTNTADRFSLSTLRKYVRGYVNHFTGKGVLKNPSMLPAAVTKAA